MYTTQVVLKRLGNRTLTLKTNGGSLTVEKQVGTNWVVGETFKRVSNWCNRRL